MKNKIRPLICLLAVIVSTGASFAASPPVRIKDLASIRDARPNQLMGFGLVVGLRQTGDSQQTEFTKQALTNLLSRMGLSTPSPLNTAGVNPIYNMSNVPSAKEFKSRNVAAVMVTAILPPFIKPGQKIGVTVSSLGDAMSLRGGTLLTTPLKGQDDYVYAVAQGPVSLGNATGVDLGGVNPEVTTSGRIPEGGIVEREVPVNYEDKLTAYQSGFNIAPEAAGIATSFTILLNEPDFTTASRVAYTIAKEGIECNAEDASSINVAVPLGEDMVSLISRIENLKVVPDVKARIVINERTGTVVIGENIRLAPVAVTYGHISVSIGETEKGSGTINVSNIPGVNFREKSTKLMTVGGGARLGDLIRSLNAIGATPKDLIAILQAIKSAGALSADIEVI